MNIIKTCLPDIEKKKKDWEKSIKEFLRSKVIIKIPKKFFSIEIEPHTEMIDEEIYDYQVINIKLATFFNTIS